MENKGYFSYELIIYMYYQGLGATILTQRTIGTYLLFYTGLTLTFNCSGTLRRTNKPLRAINRESGYIAHRKSSLK